MTTYLLFTGSHRTLGGLDDLAGVFHDELAARSAFSRARLGSKGGSEWAELAALHGDGRVQVLCWFGHLRPEPLSRPLQDPPDRRPLWRKRARVASPTEAPLVAADQR